MNPVLSRHRLLKGLVRGLRQLVKDRDDAHELLDLLDWFELQAWGPRRVR